MLVTLLEILMLFIESVYEYHGLSEAEEYEVMAPVPLIDKTPSESKVQVKLSPQVPESVTDAAHAVPDINTKNTANTIMLTSRFLIFFI